MVALPAIAVAISAISAVAGTASAVYGAQQQAVSQRNSAQAQANIANYNAQVQNNNAIAQHQSDRLQEEQYFAEAALKRRNSSRRAEEARANLLKSGITESGTGLDLYNDMATEDALDAQSSEYRGIIQRWNSKVNWNRIQSGATLSQYEAGIAQNTANRASSTMGKNMMIAGIGAGLSGAASTFGTYNSMYPKQVSAPKF